MVTLQTTPKLISYSTKKAMRISIKGKTFMHGIALNELTGLFTPSENTFQTAVGS